MTKTAATIPITENDAQYYAGQYGPLENTTGGTKDVWEFPDLNTTLISNFDTIGGTQVRDTGNFAVHALATATTTPTDANKITDSNVIVTNTTNNTIQISPAIANGAFIFLQLTDIARGDNWGSYRNLTLNDIVSNFLVAYTGEGQILTTVARTQVLFHARRAMQELSYDTLKAFKAQELTVPTGLSVPIPIDYVNYVNLCYADPNGILHPLYPLQGLSGNPTELPIIDGATGIPTQSSYDTNLEASQSIIEDRWKNANDNDITGNYDAYNTSGVYDYTWWKMAYGQRYGLIPEISQRNGWFSINERTGTFSFSSNLVNKVIELKYISDGLAYDLNSLVPKFVEDALYSKIMYNICASRRDIDGGTKQFYKRDAYVKTRNAKIRLSNLKLDELSQVLRGQSKWIKH
jgi:hypothetical protein